MTDLPHTLTLSAWDGSDYDGEDFGYWDDCEITCPHQPPAEHMPCALWEPCGCPEVRYEMSIHDDGTGTGEGACPRSATGQHRYIEGEPNWPIAVCMARDWDVEISQRAFDLGLPCGAYLVRPWWDGDTIQLDLIDPLVRFR